MGPGSAQSPHFLLGPNALNVGVLMSVQPVDSLIALSDPLYLLTVPNWALVCLNCVCSLGLSLDTVNYLSLSNLACI